MMDSAMNTRAELKQNVVDELARRRDTDVVKPSISAWCCLFMLAGTCIPTVCAASAALEASSAQVAQRPGPLSQDRLTAAAASQTEFLMTHGSYAQTRFHLADRINRQTVKNLKLAWSFEMDVTESIQTAPIVYDGVMYVTSSFDHLFALDAKTGRELWRYEHVMAPAVSLCCGPNNRGIEALDGLVYMGTLDSRVVALDARTGAVAWNMQVADPLRGYSITMAPTVVAGKVLIGLAGAEYGIRGALKALDARSGKEVWTFYTTPENSVGVWATKDAVGLPLHRDIAAEKAALAKLGDPYKTLGGSIWQNPSVDLEHRRIYFVVGNPSPDLDGSMRPGDNLYTDSLVSVDLDTGKHVCHLQYVPHDLWDLDAVSPTVLTPVKDRAGAIVPGVIHAGKTGYLYVHDARDCSLIRVSEPLIEVKNERVLPTVAGVVMRPGPNGGVSASPLAVDATHGLAFALTTEMATVYYKTPSAKYPDGKLWLGGAFKIPEEPVWGALLAVDYNSGKIRWKVKKLEPMFGGVLATAGGLIFTGEGNGKFAAYDSSNGRELWSYQADAGVNAPASTYEIDRKQYVVVGAGGNTQLDTKRGNKILAFAY
jgi:alcohol dehydrogenase (cytochrome c)